MRFQMDSSLTIPIPSIGKDIRHSLFIFGIYPNHPEVFEQHSTSICLDTMPPPPPSAPRPRVLSHRQAERIFDTYEYLFTSPHSTREAFWDVPHLRDQYEAIAQYWATIQNPVIETAALNLEEIPDLPAPFAKRTDLDGSQLDTVLKIFRTLIVDRFRTTVVSTATKQDTISVASFLDILARVSGWRGPFLVIADDVREWKEVLEEWTDLRVLAIEGSERQRAILKEWAFPVFDRYCQRQSGAYQSNLLLTMAAVFREDPAFFTAVHWQIAVNWTDTQLELTPAFEILRPAPI
jgi:hypothetical protein